MRSSFKELKGKDLIGVEIGVAKGDNAVEILKDLPIKQLHLIDNYAVERPNFEIAMKATEPYKHLIKWRLVSSQKANMEFKDDTLDFAYIDASHIFEDVVRDIFLWYPKLKKGGLLAGHDFSPFEPGVCEAVRGLRHLGFTVYTDMQFGRLSEGSSNMDWWVWK